LCSASPRGPRIRLVADADGDEEHNVVVDGVDQSVGDIVDFQEGVS